MAQEEAAAIDGASLTQRLVDIVLPSLLPAAVAGGLMAFLLAFSELTVSALLWSAGTETIGVVLYNLEEAGLASQASAVAVVIVAVVTVAMLALDALGQYLPAGTLPWHCETERRNRERRRKAGSDIHTAPCRSARDEAEAGARDLTDRALTKTEELSHAPGGLRASRLCAMVRHALEHSPYAEPGSAL